VFAESYPDDHRLTLSRRFDRIERAIFDATYKLIVSTAGKRELYDLSSDPNERRNLYTKNGEIARQLEARLAAWTKTSTRPAGHKVQVDPAVRERLKSLGYVQ
jgi:hypothetical protein